MAKEKAPPKAVNIIRPTHSFTPAKASSRVSSSSSIVSHSSFISAPPTLARKPVRVASGARILQDKPALNIYHPPSPPQRQKSTTATSSASRLPPTPPSPPARPHFEIYKPSRANRPSPSATTRVIPTSHHSDQYPSQLHQRPKPQRARSVLGPISRPEEIIRPVIQTEPDELSDMDDDDDDDGDNGRQTSADDHDQEDSDNSNDDDDEDEEEEEEDGPVNEARVNRMIEDLEISNRSLLAVNRMLEANLRKRTSEVAQMKRQLNGQAPVIVPPLPMPSEDQPSDEDDDEEWEKDETFCRLRQMTESMIEHGQSALNYKVKGLGRVISQYEPEESDDDNDDDDDDDDENSKEPLDNQQQPLS